MGINCPYIIWNAWFHVRICSCMALNADSLSTVLLGKEVKKSEVEIQQIRDKVAIVFMISVCIYIKKTNKWKQKNRTSSPKGVRWKRQCLLRRRFISLHSTVEIVWWILQPAVFATWATSLTLACRLSLLRQTLGDMKGDEQLAVPSRISGAIRGKWNHLWTGNSI